jgi:hypothetical protein
MSFTIGNITVNEIICIHLQSRKDRVVTAKRQARKKHFGMRIFKAIENKENPNIGKFESHLQCIRDARKRKFTSILILEDDYKILIPRLAVPHPPLKWDMLYLGGNIQSAIQDSDTDESQHWKRVCCLMTHAYVVNASAFDTILKEGAAALAEARSSPDTKAISQLQLDQWYCNVIHPKLHVYITTPERVIQLDGYSDVQQRHVNYRMRLTDGASGTNLVAPTALAKPDMSQYTDPITQQNYLRISLPDEIRNIADADLPAVALITCIRNQPDLFQFQQWRYYQTDYPREKMCWLIVDDSVDELKVSPLIDGADQTIKFVRCDMAGPDDFLSISKKMNLAMKYLGPQVKYVLNVSPDAIYPADHVRNRVKLLMAYPQYNCIGSTKYGVYDVSGDPADASEDRQGLSFEQTQPDVAGNPTMLFAPSLAFTRQMWMERPFDESQYTMESFYFIRGRWDQVMDVPYNMICVALTHSGIAISETARYGSFGKAITSSATGTARAKSSSTSKGNHLDDGEISESTVKAKQTNAAENFEAGWDLQTKNMILMLGGILSK